VLAQSINQKFFFTIYERVVNGGSAQVYSGHDFHVFLLLFFTRPQTTNIPYLSEALYWLARPRKGRETVRHTLLQHPACTRKAA
jgi:hypothetical protein